MNTSLNVAYGPQIAAAATRHNLDPRLLAAVAAQETGGPGADSGRNIVGDGGHGHGVFQIDDRWHDFARTPQAMDPGANADYAAGMIESNLHRYGGDMRAALSAYNAGSPTATGTTTDWGDGRPVGYADSVMRHYDRLGEDGAAGEPAATAQYGGNVTAYGGSAAYGAASAYGASPYGAAMYGTPAYETSADPFEAAGVGVNAYGSSSASDAGYDGGGLIAPSLPAYRPLPQLDQRDRDVAPSISLGDDGDSGVGDSGF